MSNYHHVEISAVATEEKVIQMLKAMIMNYNHYQNKSSEEIHSQKK